MTLLILSVGKLAVVFKDFITIENFLQDLVVWSNLLEKWIVHFTTSRWVNSDEIASSLVFKDSFANILFVPKVGRSFKWFEQWRELNRIFIDESFDMIVHLLGALSSEYLGAHHISIKTAALNSITKT